MTGEDAKRSGSILRSTYGAVEEAPTSTSRCVECNSEGQSWSGDSWSAERQILSVYACLRSGCPQNREMSPTYARLRTAGLQIREDRL